MIRPYLLFGGTELNRLEQTLALVTAAWAERWLSAGSAEVRAEMLGAEAERNGDWLALKSGASAVYLKRPVGIYKALALAMFGDVAKAPGLSDAPSPMVAGTLASALQDLGAAVLAALNPAKESPDVLSIAAPPPAETWDPGAGALMIRIECKPLQLRLLLPGSLSAAYLRGAETARASPSAAPLENPLSMLATRSVRVAAQLGEAEIDIGTLQSLAVGDVIKLDTRVDQPAQLLSADGTPLCHGYLGTRDGYKSLQLIR
jgi:flagellar motor switch/type III secretory pathway protein FliN